MDKKVKRIDLSQITTEGINASSIGIDGLDVYDILKVINSNDKAVAYAVEKQLDLISQAVEGIYSTGFKDEGRLFYIGAGASGRIGMMDAAEMGPTFGEKNKVYAVIAGGIESFTNPVELAEDNAKQGELDLLKFNLTPKDSLIGIGASGRTPYVIGGLQYAKRMGAFTIGLCMSENNEFKNFCDTNIVIDTGPEVISGSSRMKAGTAAKMVLNAISTTLMIKLNKVYDNLMVSLTANNQKLYNRCARIVKMLTHCNDDNKIYNTLEECDFNCKIAIVMLQNNLTKSMAKELLDKNKSNLRLALGQKNLNDD